MKRKVRMLPLDQMFFDRFQLEQSHVILVVQSGVHINNLIKIIEGLIVQTFLPPDAKMEWLYFDPRFNCWAVLITSETYPELAFDEMAPLLEL